MMGEDISQLHIVLFEPEIPQNTGNIVRTCACIGADLHLVEPMGFRLSDRNLNRAGLDYWDDVNIQRYSCVNDFMEKHKQDSLYFFSGQSSHTLAEIEYPRDAYLVFGRESRGIEPAILEANSDRCVRIPMCEEKRSLNLSNACAIASYEVMRQWGYPGLA